MPNLYFNKLGYYVNGDGIEIARSCPPLTFRGGDEPVLEPVQHLYAVLIKALLDLKQYDLTEDITVYNDSRIVDEMEGMASLDATCTESVRFIRQHIIPVLPTIVWFRKKDGGWVDAKVRSGHRRMIEVVDVRTRDRKAARIAELLDGKKRSRQARRIMDFKRRHRKQSDA